MRVLDHEPQSWFLLEDGDRLLFDANCNHSFLGYDWLIELNDAERAGWELDGRAYLDRLAHDIQWTVPILEKSDSPYKGRDHRREMGDEVTRTIVAWREAQGL